MGKNEKKIKTSKRNFILALILLLFTNIIMSTTLMYLSKTTLREQINQHMLDVANTASSQLDGDTLEKLTAEDKNADEYKNALKILSSFKKNIQLEYIYGIKAENDGSFTFTIDPDEDNPGEFGSPVVTTDALQNAAKGKADVSSNAYNDAWGRFYSAYSPVFDSKGNVAGIIAVDFDADWYDNTINSHRSTAVVLTVTALIAGIILSGVMISQNRKHFAGVLKKLETLDSETQKLDELILKSSIMKLELIPESDSKVLKTLASGEIGQKGTYSEYDEISSSIENVYYKLKKYLKYVDSEVFTDATTGVSNRSAYKKKKRDLEKKISAGSAEFSVAFLDINEMKNIYTHFGYEVGDKLMFECAKILKSLFSKDSVYHVDGDEFIVVAEGDSSREIESKLKKFDEEAEKYNSSHEDTNRLSAAKGFAIYDPEKFSDYRHVFIEAKQNSDKDKAEYYERKRNPDNY